jgi:MOSC domain-containing protein YiiM
MPGRVEQINIAPERHGPCEPLDSIDAAEGAGLTGCRYEDITLIQAEALEGLREDAGIALTAAESRRNVLTRGIDLNALVGKRFTVGEVECVGVELCEPCAILQRLTQPGVLRGLVHRAGINADIVRGGRIAVGDPVAEL